MPIYSFKCPQCSRRFDELLPISQNTEAVCPECGNKAERVWNGKCAFGAKRASGCDNGSDGNCESCPTTHKSSGCTGNCATCSGCGH